MTVTEMWGWLLIALGAIVSIVAIQRGVVAIRKAARDADRATAEILDNPRPKEVRDAH